jgi:hypothetical protein
MPIKWSNNIQSSFLSSKDYKNKRISSYQLRIDFSQDKVNGYADCINLSKKKNTQYKKERFPITPCLIKDYLLRQRGKTDNS